MHLMTPSLRIDGLATLLISLLFRVFADPTNTFAKLTSHVNRLIQLAAFTLTSFELVDSASLVTLVRLHVFVGDVFVFVENFLYFFVLFFEVSKDLQDPFEAKLNG